MTDAADAGGAAATPPPSDTATAAARAVAVALNLDMSAPGELPVPPVGRSRNWLGKNERSIPALLPSQFPALFLSSVKVLS